MSASGRGRKLAALTFACMTFLSACGGSTNNPTAATAGHLTITNDGGSMAVCAVKSDGSITTCEAEQIPNLNSPGSITAVGAHALVTNVGDNTVSACDLGNGETAPVCSPGFSDASLNQPLGTEISGDFIFMANANNSVAVCAGVTSGKLGGCKRFDGNGAFASPMDVSTDGARAFVTNQGDNSLAVCAVTGGALSACRRTATDVGLDGPAGLSLAGNRLYVTNLGDDSISSCLVEADGSVSNCQKLHDPINLSSPSAVVLNGGFAYVTNIGNDSLAICKLGTSGAFASCQAGTAEGAFVTPTGIAFTPSL